MSCASPAKTPIAANPLVAGETTPHDRSRNRSHWYVLHVAEGTEAAVAAKLNATVDGSCLAGAFALRKESWTKRQGAWQLVTKPLWPQYLFAKSSDAAALASALKKLSFRVELAGPADETAPAAPALDDDVRAWLEANSDASGVVRASTGEIVNGELHVLDGPLQGQESRVRRVNRHKRSAVVALGGGAQAPVEVFALNVPVKR